MLEEPKVGELLAAPSNLLVEACDTGGDGAELGQECLDEEAGRLDDGSVGGQRALGLDGVDAAIDDSGATDAVGVEEVDDGLAPRALGVGQGRPALEERDEDLGLLVAK